MANESLRMRKFIVADDLSVSTTGTAHVIDNSLNTNTSTGESLMGISKWDADSFLVLWSSSFDDPTTDIPFRTKLAKIDVSLNTNSGLTQEVWDLPATLPEQLAANRAVPSRMGNTDYVIVGSGGNVSDQIRTFDPITEELLPNYSGSEKYVDWGNPINKNESIQPVEAGNAYFDSGSAIELSDGRIMYVFIEEDDTFPDADPRHGDAIKMGFSSDALTFLGNDETLTGVSVMLTGLNAPTCSIWEHPTDGYIYLFATWRSLVTDEATAGTSMDYGIDTYPYPSSWASDSTYEFPVTVVYRTADEGSTWALHGTIQSPTGEGGGLISWSDNSGWSFGNDHTDRAIGVPDVSGGTWVLPATYYQRTKIFGQFVKHPAPGAFSSGDGVTWTLELERDHGQFGVPAQNGPNSRNSVTFDGHSWVTTGASAVIATAGGFTEWHEDYVEVAQTPYSPSVVPGAPALFLSSFRGQQSIHAWESGTRNITRYLPTETDTDGILDGMDPVRDFGDIRDNFNATIGSGMRRDNAIVQELGDNYIMFHSQSTIVGLQLLQGAHNGFSAHVVDLCSASDS